MAKLSGIQRLSNELLREILDHIEADPEKSVNIDRRAYLSVESFKPPSPPLPAQAQDVAHFRLACRRFGELGIPHQFTRVTTRFGRHGFRRLTDLAKHDGGKLARHVKKFSYMVPCFYVEGRERITELLQELEDDMVTLDPVHFVRKANDQKEIVRSKEDVRALKKAISAFTSLQHVQILRLQDTLDQDLLDTIRRNQAFATQLVELKWTPACIHSIRTVGEALLEAQSPFTRFSGPQMNPQSAIALKENLSQTFSSLVGKLTCLEIHFDDGFELDQKMKELSPVFRTMFVAASNLQAIHIGFPSRTPLSIGLEEIFHGVRWERLRAFGVQAWRLDADEIIALARRHRRTLRGLRLRDVLLKEGSMWKNVLHMLRGEMELLDWVSLRRIGYSKDFDEMTNGTIEVPDLPEGVSDSDDEDGFPAHLSNGDGDDDNDDDESDNDGEPDDDHGPEANQLALAPDLEVPMPLCNCGQSPYPESPDDWGDYGITVGYRERKIWERWVVGRCPQHSAS
ncbi:MAG: hypothetical protein M1812_006773 [Candelaria pacifica]|nr:MAG: hypothetical protein M1812_006773 [Candelaria pacifica]